MHIFYVRFISFQIKHDLVAFIRMFMIFMIAGGVTIQAVLYPNWPLNVDMIKRVLTRPIYAMFLTQVHDLDGGYNSKTVAIAFGLKLILYSSLPLIDKTE